MMAPAINKAEDIVATKVGISNFTNGSLFGWYGMSQGR
jgi:hypothetical protein